MHPTLLVYGATGYSGALIARHAQVSGIEVVVAGRDTRRVQNLAEEFGLEGRAFPLDAGPETIATGLRGATCVVNAAGPFARTAAPLMDACVRAGSHYLDVTGELHVFQTAQRLDAVARDAGVMLMPGAGWDVVAADSVAARASNRAGGATEIRLATWHRGIVGTRGSARSLREIALAPPRVWRDGKAAEQLVEPREFDFGVGKRRCYAVGMGDIAAVAFSTGASEITLYTTANVARLADTMTEAEIDRLPEGPTTDERLAARSFVLAEAYGEGELRARARLETSGGYEFTRKSVVHIALRVLRDVYHAGYQTPTSAYGDDLPEQIDHTAIVAN